MRFGFLVLILIATLLGSVFWYQTFDQVCRVPIHYRIGNIDAQFDMTQDELVTIAQNAERIWEDALSKNLFIYDVEAKLPINLIFDDRQKNAEIERELREDLEAREGMSESVASQYEKLIAEFRLLKQDYETKVVTYESRLKKYNDTVLDWNSKGGAPKTEIEELEDEEKALMTEQRELEQSAEQLNDLVRQLNVIGVQGNTLIKDYNSIVEDYNEQFSEAHEFTQGDHTISAINIYQFNTEEELTLVLAHEFGHAISLDHVANEESIMFRTMGEQKIITGISAEDKAEFMEVCKQRGPILGVVRGVMEFFD